MILSLSCDANNSKVTAWRFTVHRLATKKHFSSGKNQGTLKKINNNPQIVRNKVLLNEAHSTRIECYLNYNTIFKTNKHI